MREARAPKHGAGEAEPRTFGPRHFGVASRDRSCEVGSATIILRVYRHARLESDRTCSSSVV
jgi:hypothetical protein